MILIAGIGKKKIEVIGMSWESSPLRGAKTLASHHIPAVPRIPQRTKNPPPYHRFVSVFSSSLRDSEVFKTYHARNAVM